MPEGQCLYALVKRFRFRIPDRGRPVVAHTLIIVIEPRVECLLETATLVQNLFHRLSKYISDKNTDSC